MAPAVAGLARGFWLTAKGCHANWSGFLGLSTYRGAAHGHAWVSAFAGYGGLLVAVLGSPIR